MKNGDKLAFVFSMFLLGAFIGKNKSKKKLISAQLDPTIPQYLNRLLEFYDTNLLSQAEDEFLNLVDFGLSPKNAFLSLIQDGELH